MDGKCNVLTKAVYKNQIVSMRHSVRRARVQMVHKLTRTIKNLKSKSGTTEQKNQNLEKAERLAKEILLMKRLKDDDVAEFCLESVKDPQQVLADINDGLENKVLARLSMHSSLSSVVMKFRFNYPDWRNDLIGIANEVKKRRRKVKPSKLNKDKLGGKINIPYQNNYDNDLIKANTEGKKRDGVNSLENVPSDKESKEILLGKESASDSNESESNITTKSHGLNKSKISSKENKTILSPKEFINAEIVKPLLTTETNKEIMKGVINLDQSISNDNFDAIDDADTIPNDSSKYIDPFFITNDNKAYLSYAEAVINDNNKIASIEHDEKEIYTDIPLKNWKENECNMFNKNKRNKIDFPMRNKRNFSKNVRSGQYQDKDLPSNSEMKIKLHPSWEAKRKLSTSIRAFQGKKILFD